MKIKRDPDVIGLSTVGGLVTFLVAASQGAHNAVLWFFLGFVAVFLTIMILVARDDPPD